MRFLRLASGQVRVSKVLTVHGPAETWSIFRPEDLIHEKNETHNHGPAPLSSEGDSPP